LNKNLRKHKLKTQPFLRYNPDSTDFRGTFPRRPSDKVCVENFVCYYWLISFCSFVSK